MIQIPPMVKKSIYFMLIVTFCLTGAMGQSHAFAADDAAIRRTVQITPDNLEQLLEAGNIELAHEVNNVMRTHDEVNLARDGLFPSLNLSIGVLLTSPPQFFANSITCLVPFLFPTAWYNWSAAKKTYAAEVIAAHLSKLNSYASAYSTLAQIVNDEEIARSMVEEYERVKEYNKNVLLVKFREGDTKKEADLLNGQLEEGKAQNEMLKAQKVIAEEYSALRKMLGLHIDDSISISLSDIAPSYLESHFADRETLQDIVSMAPEREQLDFLTDAANKGVSSAKWAFLAGCTGNQGTIGQNSSAFLELGTSVNINLGFGNFPMVSIAKRAVKDLEIRQGELKLELGRLLESSLSGADKMKSIATTAQNDVSVAENLLKVQKDSHALGVATTKDVFDAMKAIEQAKIDYSIARAALMGYRIALKRMALEDQFLTILTDSRKALDHPTKK